MSKNKNKEIETEADLEAAIAAEDAAALEAKPKETPLTEFDLNEAYLSGVQKGRDELTAELEEEASKLVSQESDMQVELEHDNSDKLLRARIAVAKAAFAKGYNQTGNHNTDKKFYDFCKSYEGLEMQVADILLEFVRTNPKQQDSVAIQEARKIMTFVTGVNIVKRDESDLIEGLDRVIDDFAGVPKVEVENEPRGDYDDALDQFANTASAI